MIAEIRTSKVHLLNCQSIWTPSTLALHSSKCTLNLALKFCIQLAHLTNNTPSKSCLNPTLWSHPNSPNSKTQNFLFIFLNVGTKSKTKFATQSLQLSLQHSQALLALQMITKMTSPKRPNPPNSSSLNTPLLQTQWLLKSTSPTTVRGIFQLDIHHPRSLKSMLPTPTVHVC